MLADTYRTRAEGSAVVESVATSSEIAAAVRQAGGARNCKCADVGLARSGLRWVAIHSEAGDVVTAKRDVRAALANLLLAADRGELCNFRIIAGADVLRHSVPSIPGASTHAESAA